MPDDVFLKFDPSQTRDKWGQWSKVPGASGKAKGMATREATQSAPGVAAAGIAGGGHPADAVVEDQAGRIAEETRRTGKELGMMVDGSGTVVAEVQGQKGCIFVEQGVAYQMRNVEGKPAYSVADRGKMTQVHSHPEATGPSTRDVENLAEIAKHSRASTVITSHGDVIRMEPGGNTLGVAVLHKRLMKKAGDELMAETKAGNMGGPATITTAASGGHLLRANPAVEGPRREAWAVATHAAIVRASAGGGVKLSVKLTPETKALVKRVKTQNPTLYAKLVGESSKQRWKDLGYDDD